MKKRTERHKRNNNYSKLKNAKGVTLIALVVTIVVLLILAGVSIAMLTGDNGIITKAQEAKEKTEQAALEEQAILEDIMNMMDGSVETTEGVDEAVGVNKPKLATGMIPVKYAEGKWVKADSSNADKSWYNYGTAEDTKLWANVVTVKENGTKSRNYYTEAAVGTEIPMEDITTMFVWIPRYSYTIAGEKDIDISFLQGNSNKEIGQTTNTTKIVHPGFTMGDAELRGIWVAKFEASGLNSNGENVGNGTATTDKTWDQTTASTTGAYVTVKPSVPSWRHITIGESQYQSRKMTGDTTNYGWSNVNSHLMKNVEWGAVAYLCYSDYGTVPKINACGTYTTDKNGTGYYYDMMTGAGPQSSTSESRYNYNSSTFESNYAYNTTNGKLASTTGNETGIYDMNGGAWERVAAFLDNVNGNLNYYGKSTTDSSVKYFENGQLKDSEKYWDRYEVSEEEKSNQIKISDSETLTQSELYSSSKVGDSYQAARLRLTTANYNNMKKHKGIGLEFTTRFSYYGYYNNNGTNTGEWFEDATSTPSYATTWNGDGVLIGYATCPFVIRGGICDYGAIAGVLSTGGANGYANGHHSFRPVLAF